MPLVPQAMQHKVFSVLYSNVIIAQIIVVFYVWMINNLGKLRETLMMMGFTRFENIVS